MVEDLIHWKTWNTVGHYSKNGHHIVVKAALSGYTYTHPRKSSKTYPGTSLHSPHALGAFYLTRDHMDRFQGLRISYLPSGLHSVCHGSLKRHVSFLQNFYDLRPLLLLHPWWQIAQYVLTDCGLYKRLKGSDTIESLQKSLQSVLYFQASSTHRPIYYYLLA